MIPIYVDADIGSYLEFRKEVAAQIEKLLKKKFNVTIKRDKNGFLKSLGEEAPKE
jgi:hypothetical protein